MLNQFEKQLVDQNEFQERAMIIRKSLKFIDKPAFERLIGLIKRQKY